MYAHERYPPKTFLNGSGKTALVQLSHGRFCMRLNAGFTSLSNMSCM